MLYIFGVVMTVVAVMNARRVIRFLLHLTVLPLIVPVSTAQPLIDKSLLENAFHTIRSTVSGSGPVFADLSRTVIVAYRPVTNSIRQTIDSLVPDGRSKNILANIFARNAAFYRITRNLISLFPNSLSEKLLKKLSFHGESTEYSSTFEPSSLGIWPLTQAGLNKTHGNALLDVLGVFPIKSFYLRNLHMEVIEVPNHLSSLDFFNILKKDEFVEEAWYDSIIGTDDDTCRSERCTESDRNGSTMNGAAFVVENLPPRHLATKPPPSDPLYETQWEHCDTEGAGINTPPTWRYWTGEEASQKFVVALIDSGADYNHVDLRDNIWRNDDEICGNLIDDDGNGYIDDCIGWDFTRDDNDPMDDNGHGTASAGIIAAMPDNGVGVTPVCWGCQVMVLKALNHEIKGSVSGFVRAMEYAIEKKVRVSNNSYGGRGSTFGALQDAVGRARDLGMIFVAAAGNYRGNNDNDREPTYPASYGVDNVISVAAISRGGSLAPFSSFGRTTVDLAAPGDQVMALKPRNGYKRVDGTSFAVPFVSGAAALIWSREPWLRYNEVIGLLTRHVKKLPQLAEKLRSEGTLDVFGAMTRGTYEMPPIGKSLLSCKDESPCVEFASCIDTPTGRECKCDTGFQGDGFFSCSDVDECAAESNPCGDTLCENVSGSYRCTCLSGFVREGENCNDINECLMTDPPLCPTIAACVNLNATYDCRCPVGSAWNGKPGYLARCLKINYPDSGPCTANGPCSHGPNALCQVAGILWFQVAECKCVDGYVRDGQSDICVRKGLTGLTPDEYASLIRAVENALHGNNHIR